MKIPFLKLMDRLNMELGKTTVMVMCNLGAAVRARRSVRPEMDVMRGPRSLLAS